MGRQGRLGQGRVDSSFSCQAAAAGLPCAVGGGVRELVTRLHRSQLKTLGEDDWFRCL